jgi:hypothetical protein
MQTITCRLGFDGTEQPIRARSDVSVSTAPNSLY